VAGALAGASVVAANLVRSPVGRAIIAVRDSEATARASGISPARYKTLAFALSALYAGAAGSLYAHVVRFISPFDFTLIVSIFLVSALVIGGLASIPGSIAGALVLTVGYQMLSGIRDIRSVIYGLALVLAVIFLPGGVWRLPLRRAPSRGWVPVSAENATEVDRAAS